ncbi:MAG: hypothetical protein R6U50_18400 [Desulfobacterales bacterium]
MVKIMIFTVLGMLWLAGSVNAGEPAGKSEIPRISPESAHEQVQSGEALLVCAYDDERCRQLLLENAILRSELESRLPSIDKDREIIFYCG